MPPVPTKRRKRRRMDPRIARERGRATEQRVLEACQSANRPAWLSTARLAARREDHAGVDVVVETDVGRMYLQVKSSRLGKRTFEATKRKADIAIVVVRRDDSEQAVLAKVLSALGALRAKYKSEAAKTLAKHRLADALDRARKCGAGSQSTRIL